MAVSERSVVRSIVALISAVGLGAGGLFFGFLLTLLAGITLIGGFDVELTPTLVIVLSLVLVQGIGCAGVALAYLALRPTFAPRLRHLFGIPGTPEPFRIGVSIPDFRDVLVVVGGYFLALGGAIVGSIVVSLLDVNTGTNQAAEIGMENPEVLLVLIPASILLIGPGEELLFRGIVQGRLREVFGPISGILIPSAVFAGLHWFALSGGSPMGNLVALAVLLGPAIVFGASYEYTGNIVVPSLIHGVYNATLFTLLYVSMIYTDQVPTTLSTSVPSLL